MHKCLRGTLLSPTDIDKGVVIRLEKDLMNTHNLEDFDMQGCVTAMNKVPKNLLAN